MIKSVTGRIACPQCRTINTKYLPIFDILFPFFRFTLVDNHLRAETLEVRNATDVIHMPMCDKRSLHSCVLR